MKEDRIGVANLNLRGRLQSLMDSVDRATIYTHHYQRGRAALDMAEIADKFASVVSAASSLAMLEALIEIEGKSVGKECN